MEKRIEIVYQPHPKQFEFHENPAKFRLFLGGVGSGKTVAGAMELLRQALQQPGSLWVVVAPSYTMLRDSSLRTFLTFTPEALIPYFNRTLLWMKLLNGSEILWRSADQPEKLRGLTIAGFWIDEAALVEEKTFLILQARLRQRGFTHRGWLTTTPKGKNWLYKYFVERDGEEYALIRCSSRDNPYLPDDFVKTLEESYSDVFARQEIDAEFVSAENRVYDSFDRSIHVRPIPPDKVFKEVVAGVDWGYSNPAVILPVGIDSDGRMWVLDELYQSRLTMDELIAQAKRLKQEYNISRFIADPSEPAFIAAFNMAGLPTWPGDNSLMPGIAEISARLKVQPDGLPRLILSPKCVHTAMEFEQYRYKETKDKTLAPQPIKAFDHAMDALRYVALEVSPRRGGFGLGIIEVK